MSADPEHIASVEADPTAIDLKLYKEAIVYRESLGFVAVDLTLSATKDLVAAVEALREHVLPERMSGCVSDFLFANGVRSKEYQERFWRELHEALKMEEPTP